MAAGELEQLATLLDALDFGVIVLDRQRRIIVWNYWMASASDIGKQTALGRTPEELFANSSLGALETAVTEAIEAGASGLLTNSLHPSIFKLRTRAGQKLLHNISVRPIETMGNYHCLIQVTDVTDPTRREEVLRQRQNARFDAVMDSAADAILTLDDQGVIQVVNSAASRLFDRNKQELMGIPASTLFPDPGSWTTQLRLIMGGTVQDMPQELSIIRPDGSRRHLEASISRWLGGSRSFATAILRDVTERRAAEHALQSLNETLEQQVAERTRERDMVWRASQDLFLLCGFDLTCQRVNPAWTERLGYTSREIEGENFENFVHGDDLPAVRDRLGRLGEGIAVRDLDIRMCAKDGSWHWYSWQCLPQADRFYGAGRDITVRKQLEDQLRQSQKMEAVGQLTGGLAHDFNNLVAGITGSLEFLETRLKQGRIEDAQRYVEAARGAAKRAASLTHRLLAFSRRQTLDPKVTDILRLVAEMEELVRRTVGPGIDLEVISSPELWTVLVDRNQLENALLNLCINARDAMPRGGTLKVEISNIEIDSKTAAADDMRPGDYVSLSVSDSGTGMTKDVLDRVFDPFFTTKPIGTGTGLGLSMVHGFANQSGGQVKISSEPGVGTTVSIYLPRRDEQISTGKPDEVSKETLPPEPANGKRIMVVDDEVLVRMVIAQALEENGYEVHEAGTGAATLQILQSGCEVDLLVTDIGLPGGMSGRELAEAARNLHPGLKILFITGYNDDATLRTGEFKTGTEILGKPFDIDELLVRVSSLTA